MRGTAFLGIDPGLKGGLALLHPTDGVLVEPMPKVDEKTLDFQALAKFFRDYREDIRMALLEDVHAMPKQGVSSMFKFGRVYGAVEAMLAAFQIPYELIRPQAWMRTMHAGTAGDLETKARSRIIAARIFPGVNFLESPQCRVPHEGMVEASLIAEFGRRRELGVMS